MHDSDISSDRKGTKRGWQRRFNNPIRGAKRDVIRRLSPIRTCQKSTFIFVQSAIGGVVRKKEFNYWKTPVLTGQDGCHVDRTEADQGPGMDGDIVEGEDG